MDPLLEVDDLRTSFPSRGGIAHAVDGVSFTIARGECLALVGESGSGKSVLAASLLGLVPAPGRITGGRVRFEGKDLAALDAESFRRLRGHRIAMIMQEPASALDPRQRLGEQVAEVARAHGERSVRGASDRVHEAFRRAGLDDPVRVARSYPHQLSGGMRQRVLIAIAMLLEPTLILADEPTTALDATVRRGILESLLTLQREIGTAILLITHDLGVVEATCSRALVMRAGRVVEDAPRERLFLAPAHPYTAELLAAVPRLGAERSTLAMSVDPPHSADAARVPVLDVRGLTKRFARPGATRDSSSRDAVVRAVDDVSFSLAAGETLALVGESGSGKSTTARMVLRLLQPDAGSVHLDGTDLFALDAVALRAARKSMQAVFQDPGESLTPWMTVDALVREGLTVHDIAEGEVADRQVARLLDEVGLESDLRTRFPHELSGGQRQRIGIARALAVQPRVLVCDEVVSALDVSVQAQVLALLQRLQRERGLGYLFISHDLAVVERMATRIAVMHRGRIVESGPAERVLRAPVAEYTRTLVASAAHVLTD